MLIWLDIFNGEGRKVAVNTDTVCAVQLSNQEGCVNVSLENGQVITTSNDLVQVVDWINQAEKQP